MYLCTNVDNLILIYNIFFSLRPEDIHDLGPILWHTTGTIASLLFEFVASYQYVIPHVMSLQQMIQLCDVLSLIQCIGAHSNTY